MSLRQYSSHVVTVVNLVLMSRASAFVLVEGKSDYGFLRNHTPERVVIRDLGDRRAVLDARRRLTEKSADNFMCLVDADFDAVLGRADAKSRLVYVSLDAADGNSSIDLESTLIRTSALRKLCVEFIGSRVEQCGGASSVEADVRERLRTAAASLGAFRAAAQHCFHDGEHICKIGDVEDAEWSQFVDLRTLAVDPGRLRLWVQGRSCGLREFEKLARIADRYAERYANGWLLCRGHDLTTLLALHWTQTANRRVARPEIESKLRLAFESAMLPATAFGRRLLRFSALTGLGSTEVGDSRDRGDGHSRNG